MASDIEIAQKAKIEKITTIASKIDISEEFLVPYGHDKAKVSLNFLNTLRDRKEGNLILVSAMNMIRIRILKKKK